MAASPVSENQSEKATESGVVDVDRLDDTLIEDVSIDGMCGVY